MQIQDDYRVSLETFQGPLDLLLFLIRRAEVDIHDIPIAAITEQYFTFLREVDEIDVEVAGEFLVMAATLVEIKSRTLMPEERTAKSDGNEREREDDVDPRYELVQQLLAYQRFRNAADALEERRQAFNDRLPLRPGRTRFERDDDDEQSLELEDAHPMDLAETYERIMSAIDFSRLGDHKVAMDDTPIKLHEEDLLDQLSRASTHQFTLQSAFEGRPPTQRVGLFIATLELTRQRRIRVEQAEIDDEILLVLRDDQDDALHIEFDGLDHDDDATTTESESESASDPLAPAAPVVIDLQDDDDEVDVDDEADSSVAT